jgi:hypothetical protein
MAQQIAGSVSVWINAFIPRDVPGYTILVEDGPNTGKTVVPFPAAARLALTNLGTPTGAGFLTDQRGFSPSLYASVRMRSLAGLQVYPPRFTGVVRQTSGTTLVDYESGETLGFEWADMGRCTFSEMRVVVQEDFEQDNFGDTSNEGGYHGGLDTSLAGKSYTMALDIVGMANDPLVSGSADIDYEGTFYVKAEASTGSLAVGFRGKIDAFPSFEAYAMFNSVTKTLFTLHSPPGNTVLNLPGAANRRVEGIAIFGPDPNRKMFLPAQ